MLLAHLPLSPTFLGIHVHVAWTTEYVNFPKPQNIGVGFFLMVTTLISANLSISSVKWKRRMHLQSYSS